jgi:hypothetical protein
MHLIRRLQAMQSAPTKPLAGYAHNTRAIDDFLAHCRISGFQAL